ncbi:MAG TPA: metallophosphoesterase family protein [Opitutaceae bacterium]|nr:metallophosphoesterase family protein [Opitutaceae bacterium]
MKPTRLILALTLVAAPLLQAATTIVRGPYLQSATPTSMVIRWRTDNTEASVVSYGLTATRTELTSVARAEGIVTEHVVLLTNLKPSTKYYYTIGPVPAAAADTGKAKAPAEDAPGRTPVSSFTTPPPVGTNQPSRIWVLGDAGTKNAAQAAVRDVYLKYTGNRGTDLVLLLGDNAYPDGTDSDYQKAIFDMYAPTLKTVPFWSTLGNHDQKSANSTTQSGVYYDIFTNPTRGQAGGLMSGTEAYYSFDYANIHFICLDSQDSDRSPDGAMMQWLKADMAATKRDWQIAFFHHPTYTKGTHDSDKDSDSQGRMNDMRAVFLPALEAGGIDLVLTGHSHVYERSPLIDGHYGKSDTFDAIAHVKQKGIGREDAGGVYKKPRVRKPNAGEISVVTGSAGHASAKPVPLNHPAFVVSLNEAGSSVIDVNGLRLDLVFLNDKGEKNDWFSIVKE